MKTITAGMSAHLQEELTTLAYLWKVTRTDGLVFGFTSHDKPITYQGITYEATSGFVPTAVSTSGGLQVDDVELEGMLSSNAITQQDVIAGRWDRAEVILYQVNYNDLTDGAVILRRGWTGEFKAGKTSFITELRGLNQRLNQVIGKNFSPTCRATFCDPKCTLDINNFKVTGTVTSVIDKRTFGDTARTEADNYFALGHVTFTSGANTGISREVKAYASDTITCELPFPYAITVGDAYELFRGCDKTVATCRDTYTNLINFRGEPYMPIADQLIEGPDR